MNGRNLAIICDEIGSKEPKKLPRARLAKGDALVIDGTWHSYLTSDREGVLARAMDDSEVTRKLGHLEFFRLYYSGRLEIRRGAYSRVRPAIAGSLNRPSGAYIHKEQDEAIRRLEYVSVARRAKARGSRDPYARSARACAWLRRRRAARERGIPARRLGLEAVSASTLKEWYSRWESSGFLLAALFRQDYRKGNRKDRLDGEVIAVIHDCVETRYLTLEAPPLSLVHGAIGARILEINDSRQKWERLGEPDIRTVSRWIDRHYDEFTIVMRRYGIEKAIQTCVPVRRGPVGLWPMHTVQIDYTRLDAFCVDNRGSPLFGTIEKSRPWVIAAICTLTNMVVGFALSFDPPSWFSVMQCLRHMVVPKDVTEFEAIQSEYPCFGVCEVLQLDNEACFRSRSMTVAAAALGIELDYGPAGVPRLRGKMERFFKEVNHRFVAFTPGRSFHNVVAKGDYDSEGLATFTLEEMRRRLTIWIVDVYHNRPNGGLLGMTPLQKWDALKDLGVGLAAKVADLEALLAMSIERTVQREGVRFLGLRYTGPEVAELLSRRRSKGRKYVVKIDPQDLSQVLVLDDEPGKEKWIYLDCTTPEFVQGKDLRQWKRFCELVRERYRGDTPSRRIALEAQKLLDDEAALRGARLVVAVRPEELDWYRANLENELFDIVLEEPRRNRGRGQDSAHPIQDSELLVEDGPVPLIEAPADVAALAAPVPETVLSDSEIDFDNPDNWSDE
jgi:putative transposase